MTTKTFSQRYTDEEIAVALAQFIKTGSFQEASLETKIPPSTIRGWYNRSDITNALGARATELADGKVADGPKEEDIEEIADGEIVAHNIKLAQKAQALMDSNRIERKSFREHARVFLAAEALNNSLIEQLKERSLNFQTVAHQTKDITTSAPIGVIQFSDLHLNATITDIQENKFNLDVACQRLYKHVAQSITQFQAVGVEKVVLALTGDQIKNIQHLSEITSNSTSRAAVTMIAVDIFLQIIKHLNDEGFNVVIASVVGNESRMTEHIHETDFLASDSFDAMIHHMLQYMLEGKPGVEVVPMTNTMELVLNLNGSNLLMIHGHGHGRSAGTATIEKAFDSLAARYSSMGIRIDYMICGHIHSAYISDKFARSSSILGTDEYAGRKLNLWGRASQNAYIFYEDGTIDGFKNDLQKTDGWLSYRYDQVAAKLAIEVRGVKPNMVISANGNPFAAYTV